MTPDDEDDDDDDGRHDASTIHRRGTVSDDAYARTSRVFHVCGSERSREDARDAHETV